MKTVALHTLGCKVNYTETTTIARQFVKEGFRIVAPDAACDVYVLNTCTITERTDRECRQIIRRTLRHSPNAFVIVTGCYAQLQPDEIKSIEGVDLVLGTKEKFKIFEYANEFKKQPHPQIFVSCIDEVTEFESAYSGDVDTRTRAYLKIQDGCDYQCSFCTIPLARGQSRSKPIEKILREANMIASLGCKEIVLTGVNTGDYGRKIGTNLLTLMKQLEKYVGVYRIRISSIEPNLLTRELVDFILESEKFCNHFHIPLQSGSDVLLKLMKRRYLSSTCTDLIHYIKQRDPDAGIGVDVLVGFPGETDQLFEETYNYLAELPVSYLHVFTYSERENTPAAIYPTIIEPRIRYERSKMLRMMSKKKRLAFYSSYLDKTLKVLFEHRSHNGKFTGLTENYIRVEVETPEDLTNQLRNVYMQTTNGDVCQASLTNIEKYQ